jgi:FlaA1/EpsC-like NDP-sugar epimerase
MSIVRIVQNSLDMFILASAFIIAYLLRFDFSLTPYQIRIAIIQMIVIAPIQFWALRICQVHKFIWRYVSLREMNSIVLALGLATIPALILRLFLAEIFYYAVIPLSIIIVDFILAVIGILGIRLVRREIFDSLHRVETSRNANSAKKAVLLVGAGRAGVMTLTEIKARGDIDIEVRGFMDDDKQKVGAIINGVEVLGTVDQIPEFVIANEIDYIIISIAQASREEFQRILEICRSIPIRVRTIPGLYELLQNKVSVSRIRDIEIEDLLGRFPVQLDQRSIEKFLKNKVVMVTGAGGSIGSELVRQLVHCKPDQLVLVERCEFSLFQIEREILEGFPEINITPVIADVCDSGRMENVFKRFSPQVVFHSAAHKHVPMMELNASEAIKNNILGTHIVGDLAGKFRVEAFVFISTDKAVNPTSVMGATKRVSELVVQDLNGRYQTRFVAVRFGNVIGSNGSVIPTFREQIRKGGPITVTHRDMERYFMTIPEASQLVLQAGAICVGGEIFVLDMGKPIKILDLARETIRLSGLRPGVDIEIVFTGVRPGEKLYEELQSKTEKLLKTTHPKIYRGKIDPYPETTIIEMLDIAHELSISEDDEEIRRFLNSYLPEANLENSREFQLTDDHINKDLYSPTNKAKLAAASG